MTNFPTSLDDSVTLPSPAATDKQNSPSHSNLHSIENSSIIAIETKLGIGSSTAAANKILLGTGAGTSAWQQLTSAELRGVLSDETGTGSAVFASSPTIATPTLTNPKVDTINEDTSGNGITVDGLNIKDGKLNTTNSVEYNSLNLSTFATTGYGKVAWSNSSAAYSTNSATLAYIDETNAKVTATIRSGKLVMCILHVGGVYNSNTGYVINFNIGIGNATAAGTTSYIGPAAWTGVWSTDGSRRIADTLVFFLTSVPTGSQTFYPLWATSNATATAYIGQYGACSLSVVEII